MKHILIAAIVLIAISGCMQLASQSSGIEGLREIELRYLGRGTIAPATIADIGLMEKELLELKQKSSAGAREMIEIRLELLGFSRNYLEAQKSIQKISVAKGGCEEADPLKQSINRIGETLEKAPAIRARISVFQANNPELDAQSNISSQDFEDFAAALQNLRQEMQDFYNQACAA